MTVTSKIEIREIDGIEIKLAKRPTMEIQSHRLDRDFAVIIIGDKSYTVMAEELIVAARNSKSTK